MRHCSALYFQRFGFLDFRAFELERIKSSQEKIDKPWGLGERMTEVSPIELPQFVLPNFSAGDRVPLPGPGGGTVPLPGRTCPAHASTNCLISAMNLANRPLSSRGSAPLLQTMDYHSTYAFPRVLAPRARLRSNNDGRRIAIFLLRDLRYITQVPD
jgi:hypothetical protein